MAREHRWEYRDQGRRINLPKCPIDGKPCYDKRGAQTAANKRFDQEHIRLRIYQCGNHWHLTHILNAKLYNGR